MDEEEKKKLAQELKSQHRDFWQVLEDLKGISLDSSAQGIGDKQALKSELKAQYELASDVLHVLETEPPTRSVEYANRVLAKNELAAYGREFNTISQNTKNGIIILRLSVIIRNQGEISSMKWGTAICIWLELMSYR